MGREKDKTPEKGIHVRGKIHAALGASCRPHPEIAGNFDGIRGGGSKEGAVVKKPTTTTGEKRDFPSLSCADLLIVQARLRKVRKIAAG